MKFYTYKVHIHVSNYHFLNLLLAVPDQYFMGVILEVKKTSVHIWHVKLIDKIFVFRM